MNGADYTALIPTRWPYAPVGTTILTVPPDTFAGDWGGRWEFATKTAYINNGLPVHVQIGIIAHELGHGRWSAPLPHMPGEEGGAALAVELFDELRVERFAIAHTPTVRQDVRGYLMPSFDGSRIRIPNARSAAIVYGTFMGRILTGALTAEEIGKTVNQFRDFYGPAWCDVFDAHLGAAFDAPPGGTGDLVAIARRWDWDAIHPPLHVPNR